MGCCIQNIMCAAECGHLQISVVLSALLDFSSWKKKATEVRVTIQEFYQVVKKCKVLQGGYKMTAGIYSTLVTPYFMVLQGTFAAAEQ